MANPAAEGNAPQQGAGVNPVTAAGEAHDAAEGEVPHDHHEEGEVRGAGEGEGGSPAVEGSPDAASGGIAEPPSSPDASDDVVDGPPTPEPAKAPSEEPKPSAKDLLKEAARSKTDDARARKALDEAQAAGATPRDAAKAAFDRGKALHASPDRATTFFQWAAEKDPKYADPVFALAQQTVVIGDVEATIRHLKEVKARKGDKLLQQIEFDPMWEIVKDDPAVRGLL